jgi:hypothetical protein
MSTVQDWSEALLTSLSAAMAVFFAAIPKVIGFAVILLVGWFIASLIARGVAALLRAVKFNEFATRSGFAGFIQRTGVRDTDSAGFLAAIAKWFIRLMVLVVAFDALGLPAVSDVLRELLLWLPNLAVGMIALVIGGLLANAAAGLVQGATATAGFQNPQFLSGVARTTVWIFAIIVAVNQIGIAKELVNTLFMGAVAFVVLALGLSFGLGGRDEAAQLLAKWHAQSRENADKAKDAVRAAGQQARSPGGDGGVPAHGYGDKA